MILSEYRNRKKYSVADNFIRVRLFGVAACLFWLLFPGGAPTAEAGQLDNWHVRNPLPLSNPLRSICFGQGKFVAVGDGGLVHTSTDGVTWDDGRRVSTNTLHKIAYVSNQFITVGADGLILTSPDGGIWTPRS